jgi:hypothetical protein
MYVPLAEAAQPYSYHRRDKTKSSQSYLQTTTNRERPGQHAKTASGATVAQRPDLKERAYSAPHIPKAQDASRQDEHALEEEDFDDDDGPAEDEEIAGDPFFQQYARAEGGAAETPGNSEPEDEGEEDSEGPLSPTSTATRFRPDSIAEPLGSPLSPPPVCAPLPQ